MKKKGKNQFLIASAGMILPPALLFYALANTPHIIITPIIIYIVSFFRKKSFTYSDRSVIYSIMTALVLAVLLNMLFPMHQERFLSIGKAFTPQVTIPFFVFIAAISTFFKNSQYSIGLNATLAMFVLLMAGDFQGLTSYNENSSILNFLVGVKYYRRFFLTVAMIDLIAIIIAFYFSERSPFHKINQEIKKIKLLLIFVALLVVACASFVIYGSYIFFKSDLRQFEQYLIQFRHFSSWDVSNVLFGKEVDLNRTINGELKKNRQLIMIRVEGNKPPGYLRGRSYDTYSAGKWTQFSLTLNRFKETPNIGELALSAFYMNQRVKKDNAKTKYNIFLTDACVSNYIFYPPNAQRIEMVAEHLNVSHNGDFLPKEWNKDGGYTAYQYDNPPFPAYQKPRYPKESHYLFIPRCVKNAISNIADRIDQKNKDENRILSDMEMVTQITSYLENNYSYSLNPPKVPLKSDPVSYFLMGSKKGHCELFATAATMLLRYKGIPSRYITGFVCSEPHPSGKYYVARMGNAHAWSEAYLRDKKKWVLVEATPPSGMMPYKSEWGLFESWFDKIKYSISKRLSEIRRGYFTRGILNFFYDVFDVVFSLLYHPARGPVFLCVVLCAVYLFRKYRKNKIYTLDISSEVRKVQRLLKTFIHKLEKETGIRKEETETLDEWMSKIEKSSMSEKEKVEQIRDLVARYREIRFLKNCQSREKIKKFALDLKLCLKNIR